jgi:hypothetical protein
MKSLVAKQHSNVVAVQPLTTFSKDNRTKTQSSITLKLPLAVAIVITLALSAISALGQSANPNENPNQIAILRWYQANTVGTTFSMGSHASTSPITFDGENIWVASTDGYLAEFSTDGKLLYGPIALPGSNSYPVGMTFDGANVWVTDIANSFIDKFNVNTHIMSHYNVVQEPYFIAFDGANVWVTSNHDNTVAAYRASNGTLAKGPYSTRGTSATGVAFDGKCIWVANTDSNSVSIFDAGSTGGPCLLNGVTTSLPVSQPFGLAYDGFNMWVSYRGPSGTGPGGIVKLAGTTGAYSATYGGCTTSGGTGTLVFDGAYLWEAGSYSGICKYKSSLFSGTLGLVARYSSAGMSVNQVVFDGANVWASMGGSFVAKF